LKFTFCQGKYIFETHPQQYVNGSVFFDSNSFNAGFIALIPFKKLENGLYQVGFCYEGSIRYEDRFLSKDGDTFSLVKQS
jgi:hypothetical protein